MMTVVYINTFKISRQLSLVTSVGVQFTTGLNCIPLRVWLFLGI